MIRSAVLTSMSTRIAGGAETTRLTESIAAMENMEAVEAPFREAIAERLQAARKLAKTVAAMSDSEAVAILGNREAVIADLRAAIRGLEETQVRLECGRESRQKRLREARSALAGQRM